MYLQSNYKNYRDKLSITPIPAVPYIGVFLKDLTFIADGNPDYIRGGLVNLHKRRQVRRRPIGHRLCPIGRSLLSRVFLVLDLSEAGGD